MGDGNYCEKCSIFMDLNPETISFKSSDYDGRYGDFYCPYIPLTIFRYEKDGSALSFEVDTRIQPSTWISNENKAHRLREQYYEVHKKCPICSSYNICQTLIGYTFDAIKPELYKDKNKAECNCGWIGTVHDMT